MKKTLVTLALAGSFAFGMIALPAFAQDSAPPPPPMHQGMGGMHHGWHHRKMTPEWQLEHLTKMLDLSAEQQAKLKPILVERDQKMRAIWKEHAQEMKQMRQQMMAANQESKTQVDAVLTPEQQQKLHAIMHRRMERMRQWRHNHGAPPPPASQPQQQ
jgi:Spy/CpxP family protein refolding chaperone